MFFSFPGSGTVVFPETWMLILPSRWLLPVLHDTLYHIYMINTYVSPILDICLIVDHDADIDPDTGLDAEPDLAVDHVFVLFLFNSTEPY